MILARLPAAEDAGEEAEEEEDEAYLRHLALRQAGELCRVVDREICWYCEYEDWEDNSDEDWEDDGEEPEPEGGAWSAARGTFCGFKKSFLCKPPSASDLTASSSPASPLLDVLLPRKQLLTAEEAERNAEELVAEEERVKRKAEKKRQKKKRQKDRKRQEKRKQELKAKSEGAGSSHSRGVDSSVPSAAVPSASGTGLPDSEGDSAEASPGRSPSRGTEEKEEEALAVTAAAAEEELDLSSTFVSKALLKVGTKPLLPKKEKAAKPDVKEAEGKARPEVPRTGPRMTAVEQSMMLADCGNEMAKQGLYQEAVLLFTEAVKLNPREYRFFGNRSFCYERLQCYVEALRDAQLALSLQPGWPKGLFRQGKALMGLKRYAEAAKTFEELLRLEDFRADAAIQLKRCQVHCLLGNTFGGCLPGWNVLPRESRPPLPGEQQSRRLATSVSSAQAGGHLASITSSLGKGVLPSAALAPARECFAVWVGNLTPEFTQEVLLHYFRPFGPIDSIRRLPRKFCAFVNYTHREAAEAAYAALQGAEVKGSKLVLQLKHPIHATPPLTKAPGAPRQPLKA